MSIDLATWFKIGMYLYNTSFKWIAQTIKDMLMYHKVDCYALDTSTKKQFFESFLLKCVSRPDHSGVPLKAMYLNRILFIRKNIVEILFYSTCIKPTLQTYQLSLNVTAFLIKAAGFVRTLHQNIFLHICSVFIYYGWIKCLHSLRFTSYNSSVINCYYRIILFSMIV